MLDVNTLLKIISVVSSLLNGVLYLNCSSFPISDTRRILNFRKPSTPIDLQSRFTADGTVSHASASYFAVIPTTFCGNSKINVANFRSVGVRFLKLL